MSDQVRVRFAPSPTGYLHIGGARTALYSLLYARAHQGKFILRVEDTDIERSKREYEVSQLADLAWLGIEIDEGPFRQSERMEIYLRKALELIDKGSAYYCFCSEEALEEKKERARAQNRPPHYDGTCRSLSHDELSSRLSSGERGAIRFKAPKRPYVFTDLVRSRVVFPEGMVGDFVILRSNQIPVYNFCCVVDDFEMKITHVIRAEEHLPNTLRQLMIYEALGATPPEFAHASLLVGKDRQKLSKRHGATSVAVYREEGFLPEAMNNYLCLLGWSHPEEKDVFSVFDLGEKFKLERLSKSPAMFDLDKLKFINGQHLRSLSSTELRERAIPYLEGFAEFMGESESWQNSFLSLFKEQVQFFSELPAQLAYIFSEKLETDREEFLEILKWESTREIEKFVKKEISAALASGKKFPSEDDFLRWQNDIKKEHGIKGKGLFKGMRAILTGAPEGPELKDLIPLTPFRVLEARLAALEKFREA